MEKSHDALKRAISKAGVKSVAAALNLSPALVYKWCEEVADSELETSGVANPLDRIKQIYELTQDIDMINWICKVANGFFIKDPIPNPTSSDVEMVRNTQRLIKEFSDTLNAIALAYSDDKLISNEEAARIRTEWEDLKRAGEAFVRDCERGVFGQPKKKKKKK